MNLIESKVIQTKFEKEIFIDEISNIELSGFQYPNKNIPYYEMMVGVDLMRIRNNEFYGTKKSYFGLRITEDLQSIVVFDPDQQSIFAVKNELEKQAAIELIDYLLIESPKFKELVRKMIYNNKQTNVVSDIEIQEHKAKLSVLEGLLNVPNLDVKIAVQKKKIAC
ncbi:hypothetical protein QNH39_01295 [Neobacillus novalis]|uniref:Uncharacterized protein n=1 Tax=Neobacillus novalis TaxID=220687 RepID=A0AA95MRB2_9BACI|nr:hypothetical protein [Neobacillus novalis]WHY86558.1 hypothetical protein QNH39_01295 [Neobacillus novalis]